MIRAGDRLREFESWYAAHRTARRTYSEALTIYAALWVHARNLNPEFPAHWKTDIEADIELARVLNGLPKP